MVGRVFCNLAGSKCKHTPYLQPLVYILSSGDCARNVEQSLFFQQ